MKKRLNILSIDFDFFQQVDVDTILECYPDAGVELPEKMQNFIWKSKYAIPECAKKLLDISINEEQFKELKKILQKNYVAAEGVPLKPSASIGKSHKDIYEFILSNYDKRKYNGITLYNIDMHSDIINLNNTVDCGNWIHFLLKKIQDVKVKWICNPISLEAYKIETPQLDAEKEIIDKVITNDFSEIKNKQFDLVFLCRSDPWLPPHLDKKFVEIAKTVLKYSSKCDCDKNIFRVR